MKINKNFKKDIFFLFFLFFLLFVSYQNILAINFLDRGSQPAHFGSGVNFLESAENFLELLRTANGASFQKRQKALEKSSDIKGIYLTQYIAGSNSSWTIQKRKEIKKLLKETELNGVVIDVKEVRGCYFTDSLKKFIVQLHQDDIWVIARIVAFRDSSLISQKPEMYLKTSSGSLWQDEAGYFWLDPACLDVQEYILEVSQKAIDFGFDEIQFDYLRFPDRGELKDIVYPCYEREREKREAINDFYLMLSNNLRDYKKDIILSVDLFGLVAQYLNISGTGQNLSDTLDKFDYVSFMIYPSHFFGGFVVQKDLKRNLPALYFPYRDKNIERVVSEHPYEVVSRTLFNVSDYISSQNAEEKDFLCFKGFPLFSLLNHFFSEYNFFLEDLNKIKTKIRPWLQDFDLRADSKRGIHYDAEKVRAQIKASEDANSAGWLLWNPSNIYTKEALKPD